MIFLNYKELIDSRGIKYSFIANKLGVSPAFVTMFLKGDKKLPKQREEMLKDVLGLHK